MGLSEPAARRRQLLAALAHLERVAWDLNSAATWLGDEGHETEAEMIEQSARSILAACWLLYRPYRKELPPGQWQQVS
jgi:hypothetical protein